jgi:hypothetical protein
VRTAPVRGPLLLPTFGDAGNKARIETKPRPETAKKAGAWKRRFSSRSRVRAQYKFALVHRPMTDEIIIRRREIEARKLQALELLAEAEQQLVDLAAYERLQAKLGLGNKTAQEPPGAAPNDSNHTEAKTSPVPPPLTLAALAESYFNDERSPIHPLRFRTRKNYIRVIKAVIRQHGERKLADLNAEVFQAIYDEWNAAGKVSMAHAKIAMMRILFSFGTDILKDSGCEKLSFVLHRMKFSRSKTKNQQKGLTSDEVAAIIGKAHEMDLSSMALAVALQFECRKLRQKDIIGEWVPISERSPPSEIIDGGNKWVHGIRWNYINENLILRHTLCWERTEIEIDLRKAPMVRAELEKIKQRLGSLPTQGAVIVNEKTELPWDYDTFRARWRSIADAAGLSKDAKYADSRTGRRRRSA